MAFDKLAGRVIGTILLFLILVLQFTSAVAAGLGVAQTAVAPRDASAATISANAELARNLPKPDASDAEDAARGFIGTVENAETLFPNGTPVSTMRGFEFIQGDVIPPTINPGLWRQAKMNIGHGLYKVTDRVYQVRGFDIANLTIVEGKTGLLLVDALMTTETARAALALYYRHRPKRPVLAVFYNHSHVDHYGGIKGLVDERDVKSGKVKIIAPQGFMKETIAENVLAGNAMSRRAQYQFGIFLPRDAKGFVDLGGAKALSRGTVALIPPNQYITKPVEKLVIDGVEIINMLTPGTEAPAEMIHYFPQFGVLDTGELALHTQHQLLTLRGAEIRDGNAWAKYLNEALTRFGSGTNILIGQHTWPVFGHDRVVNYLTKQRDLYKWLHDQSLRLINQGYKPAEIAETMVRNVPASLAGEWFTRGNYGSVGRNAKAVYQKYLGWYDANPANMEQLSPVAYGQKFVEYGGGVDAVLQRARDDYAKGDYRWVAQATSHVVFADPANQAARNLGADALEQLGYQAESGVERNVYLVGALELRNGMPEAIRKAMNTASADTIKVLSIEDIFDLLGVRLNGPKAEGQRIVLIWNFTDSKQRVTLNLENSALTFAPAARDAKADATLNLTRETLNAILLKQVSVKSAIAEGKLVVTGDVTKLMALLGMLDEFSLGFEVVAPNPVPGRS